MSDFIRGAIGGAVSGLAGGVAMALFLALAAAAGPEPWYLAAAWGGLPLFGDALLEGAAWPVVAGFLVFFAACALWGLLFGVIVRGQPKGLTYTGGLGWGFVAWPLFAWVIAPALGYGSYVQALPIGRSILAFCTLGLAMGLAYLPWQERRARPGRVLRHGRHATA